MLLLLISEIIAWGSQCNYTIVANENGGRCWIELVSLCVSTVYNSSLEVPTPMFGIDSLFWHQRTAILHSNYANS